MCRSACANLKIDVHCCRRDLKLHEVVPRIYTPRWNVPPTEMLPAITSKDGKRRLEPMRWGLMPSWAKEAKIGFSSFNARADGVATKPAFKGAWTKGRRCLIVTHGFYEWKKLGPDGKEKQPYAVALGNRGPMLMAGLWDVWKNPADGQWLRSCTIITTDADELIAPIHDRMPVILDAAAQPIGTDIVRVIVVTRSQSLDNARTSGLWESSAPETHQTKCPGEARSGEHRGACRRIFVNHMIAPANLGFSEMTAMRQFASDYESKAG